MNKLPFKNYFFAGLGINLGAILLILLFQKRLPPEIPLYYGLPQGNAQLAKPLSLLWPAVFSISIIAVNIFLARILKDDFLKKVLAVFGLATAVLAAITSFKIAFLVGNL